MSFWSRDERELMLSFSTEKQTLCRVYANWPYYVTRFERCEAFEPDRVFVTPDGRGRAIEGELDLSEFSYLWLRRALSEPAQAEFESKRSQLLAAHGLSAAEGPIELSSPAQLLAHERETVISGVSTEPYWLEARTEMHTWLERLSGHPHAVCVSETRYAGGEALGRHFFFPRRLLTIRRQRPQLSEQRRQELREQLGLKPAASA